MIETATVLIRGERFLFKSFDNGLGEQPEGHGKTYSTPGTTETLLRPAGHPSRRTVSVPPINSGGPAGCFDNLLHAAPCAPKGQHDHAS